MHTRSKLGIIISLVFSSIGFILALYDIFSPNSGVTHMGGSWFTGLFTLLSIIFATSMFSAKSSTPGVLNVLCVIIAGIITIYMGLYWIFICMVVSLIGCIIYKAGKSA